VDRAGERKSRRRLVKLSRFGTTLTTQGRPPSFYLRRTRSARSKKKTDQRTSLPPVFERSRQWKGAGGVMRTDLCLPHPTGKRTAALLSSAAWSTTQHTDQARTQRKRRHKQHLRFLITPPPDKFVSERGVSLRKQKGQGCSSVIIVRWPEGKRLILRRR